MFPLHPRKVPSAYPPPYNEEEQSPTPPTPPSPAFTSNKDLILKTAPPLDPDWLAHEVTLPYNPPNPDVDIKVRQQSYSQSCKDLNTHLLSGLYSDLNDGIKIFDTVIDNRIELGSPLALSIHGPPSSRDHKIPVRSYNPAFSPNGPPPMYLSGRPEGVPDEGGKDIVIYYHGGGLYVGDLDSEDLTCRRICKQLGCTVYSVDYRLMPEWTADDAVYDALEAFRCIISTRKVRRLIVMGSSSGAQLAAMVAASYKLWRGPSAAAPVKIHGVCLRGPVLCDATDGGANLPPKFREFHSSMSESFHTSLLSTAAVNQGNRTSSKMPLEAETFEGLPRHWIQVCTNDIYYSDGVIYSECLRDAGIDVRLDVLRGWPHTFWLKAPELQRAIKAEQDCVEGVRWLLESDVGKDKEEPRRAGFGYSQPGGFVPLTDEEFERRFSDMQTEGH